MSPGLGGVFRLMKKVNFRRILAFYSLWKWGTFWGHLFAAECALVGCDTIRIDLMSHGPISP